MGKDLNRHLTKEDKQQISVLKDAPYHMSLGKCKLKQWNMPPHTCENGNIPEHWPHQMLVRMGRNGNSHTLHFWWVVILVIFVVLRMYQAHICGTLYDHILTLNLRHSMSNNLMCTDSFFFLNHEDGAYSHCISLYLPQMMIEIREWHEPRDVRPSISYILIKILVVSWYLFFFI